MKIGLIGDLHSVYEPAIEWINETSPDFCIQLGDFWSYNTEWPVLTAWFFGNHEQLDFVNAIERERDNFELPYNSHWLNGGIHEVLGVKIMCLPSVPSLKMSPGPAKIDRKAYDVCMKYDGEIDLFVSHGCGFPFYGEVYNPWTWKKSSKNFEDADITALLRKVRPTYAASGHNHLFGIENHEGIECIRLGMTNSREQFAYLLEI